MATNPANFGDFSSVKFNFREVLLQALLAQAPGLDDGSWREKMNLSLALCQIGERLVETAAAEERVMDVPASLAFKPQLAAGD